MNIFQRSPVAVLFALLTSAAVSTAQNIPSIRSQNGESQLIVHGNPYLILGGELGNSSAGTATQADTILPKLAQLHFNTALMPVAWDQIEPEEGHFDFSVPDHWIDVAREQHLHLVLLWFGSWKNAFSEYAPQRVCSDTKRFARSISAEGLPTEILSPLGEETARCDARAFAALMRHLRDRDAEQQTVLMIQVENEVGFLGTGGRDRSEKANRLFQSQVPQELSDYLKMHSSKLSPELLAHFNSAGRTWKEMFGETADEALMAWHYGRFVNEVVKAGKAQYPLPMYMNAQVPAEFERAGEYPSGGPYPLLQAIYRVAAPSIDFYAPDIYWPDFPHWINQYKAAGNPVFIPEARLDQAAGNALYAYGEAGAFGFSPFAVDSLPADGVEQKDAPGISDVYRVLAGISDQILLAQASGKIRALVLHESSPRPSQTISLGGFLFRASLARTWPSNQLATPNGATMVIQSGSDEFLMIGSGLSVTFTRDPDVDDQIAGIAGIDQVAYVNGQRLTEQRLNGDQTDQGRRLLMNANKIRIYRVKLFTYSRQ